MVSESYLLERLIGAIIYISVVMFFYYSLKRKKSFRQISKCIFKFVIILSIMAYFYVPSKTSDLYRLNVIGDIWVQMGFKEFSSQILFSSTTPVANLLVYLSRLSKLDGLLPALSAFVFYSNVFHIVKTISKKEGTSSSHKIAILVLFTMSSDAFLSVISGIRSTMAFSIIARFYFDEILDNKGFMSHLPFYVMACLIHTAAIPLFILRIFTMAFSKNKNFILKLFQLLLISVGAIVIYYFGSRYIDSAIDKFFLYSTTETYSNIKIYILTVFKLIYLSFITIKYVRFDKNRINLDYVTFLVFMVVIEFVLIGNFVIFARYLMYMNIIIIPAFHSYLSVDYTINNSTVNAKRYNSLFLVSILFLVLSCMMGDLSAYKFFVLGG